MTTARKRKQREVLPQENTCRTVLQLNISLPPSLNKIRPPLFNYKENQGRERTQFPTATNYAVQFPALGSKTAEVSTPQVQWVSLSLGKPTRPILLSPSAAPTQPHPPCALNTQSLLRLRVLAFSDAHLCSKSICHLQPGFSSRVVRNLYRFQRDADPEAHARHLPANITPLSQRVWVYPHAIFAILLAHWP